VPLGSYYIDLDSLEKYKNKKGFMFTPGPASCTLFSFIKMQLI